LSFIPSPFCKFHMSPCMTWILHSSHWLSVFSVWFKLLHLWSSCLLDWALWLLIPNQCN
jgi:hypothetical protein